MVFQTEKALEEVGAQLDPADKSAVEAEISSLKAVLDRTKDQTELSDADIDELKSGKEKLMNAAQKVFEKVYQQAQAAQGAGGQAGPGPDMNQGGTAGGADDVVDGDYREV